MTATIQIPKSKAGLARDYAIADSAIRALEAERAALREALLERMEPGDTVGLVTRKDIRQLVSTSELIENLKGRKLWSTVSKTTLIVEKLRALAHGQPDLEADIERLGDFKVVTRLEVDRG